MVPSIICVFCRSAASHPLPLIHYLEFNNTFFNTASGLSRLHKHTHQISYDSSQKPPQKYEQYRQEYHQLIHLMDLYCLCCWAAGWGGRGHIWSLRVIALPCLLLPTHLKVGAGLGHDLQWSDVFSGRTARAFTFSHNSFTFMAGRQKIISLIIIIVIIVILSKHRITCLTAVMWHQKV